MQVITPMKDIITTPIVPREVIETKNILNLQKKTHSLPHGHWTRVKLYFSRKIQPLLQPKQAAKRIFLVLSEIWAAEWWVHNLYFWKFWQCHDTANCGQECL